MLLKEILSLKICFYILLLLKTSKSCKMMDDYNFCGNAYTRSACENWYTLCRKFGNLNLKTVEIPAE